MVYSYVKLSGDFLFATARNSHFEGLNCICHTFTHFSSRSKCEFLAVTNKKSPLNSTYHINEVAIKAVQNAKYLGVTIDSKLIWKEHIMITTHKAIQH